MGLGSESAGADEDAGESMSRRAESVQGNETGSQHDGRLRANGDLEEVV